MTDSSPLQTTRIGTAIVPAAGAGLRMLPASRAVPKFLMPVHDRPAIAHVVAEARAAGVDRIVIVVAPGGEGPLRRYFTEDPQLDARLQASGRGDLRRASAADIAPPGLIRFAVQDRPLGLGHAIWSARGHLASGPIAVLLPDVLIRARTPCLAQMAQAHGRVGGNLVAVDAVPEDLTRLYGIVELDSRDPRDGRMRRMTGVVEKPGSDPPSRLKLTGRYILQPEIIDRLRDLAPGAGGEIQLTDAMAAMMTDQTFRAFEYEGRDHDCGSFAGLCGATVAWGLDDPRCGAAVRESVDRALRNAATGPSKG